MSAAPRRSLRARGRMLGLGERPLLMGIVNASPDSFSDSGARDVDTLVAHAAALLDAGADIVDIGGETAAGGRPAVDAAAEIARVVPVIERVASDLGALVSVDTYKPAVAEAAIAAGAALVNDVSGLRDEAMADVCARTGAALVVMHTRAEPKRTLLDPAFYDDVIGDVLAFLGQRLRRAEELGVAREQLLVDPGPDFAKTPAQTVAVLRRLEELHALGRPLVLAVSRKDFLGALVGRAPAERGAATLAALADGVERGAHVLRVHDVAAAADFLAVRAALRGEREIEPESGLSPDRYPPGTVVPGSWRPPGALR